MSTLPQERTGSVTGALRPRWSGGSTSTGHNSMVQQGEGCQGHSTPTGQSAGVGAPSGRGCPVQMQGPLTGVSLGECRDRGSPSRGTGEARWGWRGQGDREHWGSVGGSPLPSRSPGQERDTGTVSRQGGAGQTVPVAGLGRQLVTPSHRVGGASLSTTTGHRVSSHHRTPAQTAPDPVCQRGALQGLQLDKRGLRGPCSERLHCEVLWV